jgi:transposase
MKFRELSDDEWEFIRPLLPPRAKVGRLRTNDRKVMNGILYVGVPCHIPSEQPLTA